MKILIFSCAGIKQPSGGGGGISTFFTIKGLKAKGQKVKAVDSLKEFRKELKEFEPDVVLHHNLKDMKAVVEECNKASAPVIVTVNIGLFCGTGLHLRYDSCFGSVCRKCSLEDMLACAIERPAQAGKKVKAIVGTPFRWKKHSDYFNALQNADAIITLGPAFSECLQEKGITSRIFLSPQPIDSNLFKMKRKKTKKKTVLFAGGKTWFKGYEVALKTFYKLKDKNYRFMVAGPEFYDFKEKDLRKYLHEKIEFKGNLSFKQTRKLYSQADVLLYPNLSFGSFGRLWAEALAAGTPVIAFNQRGSASEYLKNNETGLLVPLNVNKVADATEKLLENKKLWKKLSDNGKKFAKENFSEKKVARQILSIIKKTI